MRGQFLPFYVPEIGEDEIESLIDTLRSGWLTTCTTVVLQFEAHSRAPEIQWVMPNRQDFRPSQFHRVTSIYHCSTSRREDLAVAANQELVQTSRIASSPLPTIYAVRLLESASDPEA
jgi:hypothetical protein